MNTTKQIATTTLIILLGVIAYGLFRTGSSMTTSQITTGRELSQAPSAIDQTPLYTAQRLAQMSTSADELPLQRSPCDSVIARWTWLLRQGCGKPKRTRPC